MLTVNPVTDPTTMQDLNTGNYSEPTATDKLSAEYTDGMLVVTSTGSGTYQLKVTVDQPSDRQSCEADLDGSEHLIQLVARGVPDGVTITSAGWVYYGSDGGANTGMWVKTFTNDKIFTDMNNTFEEDIKFTVDSGSANLWSLNHNHAAINITAVTQDVAGTLKGAEETSTSAATHYLAIDYASGGGPSVGWTASAMTITSPAATMQEDGESTTLSGLLNAALTETTRNYRFTIALSGLKEGTVIGDGVHAVTVGAAGTYTISGYGTNATLQALLAETKVTLPADFNDENGSGTAITATYTTYGQAGTANTENTPATGTAISDYTVTPVTDGIALDLASAAPKMDENQADGSGSISFSLGLDAGTAGTARTVTDGSGSEIKIGGDGTSETIVNGKIYIKLTDGNSSDANDPMAGTITYGGVTYSSTAVSGVSGIANGNYYVVEAGTQPFESNSSVTLANMTYKPADYYSGTIVLTAFVAAQETGAANTVVTKDSLTLVVNPVDSAYTLTAANATGNEDGRAVLSLSSVLTDTSEAVKSVVLSGFPIDAATGTSNFQVFCGTDATSAVLASKFYNSATQTYEWSITLNSDGSLPAYVAVQGLNNYSGTQNIKVTALHGESGIETTTAKNFDIVFQPLADGLDLFAPDTVLVDGTRANGQVALNLNADMVDIDGSETATFTFKGMGDGVTFYDRGAMITAAYDADTDTYTISGIAHDHLGSLTFISPLSGTGTVTAAAWTVDRAEGLTDSVSSSLTGSFAYHITQQTPNSANNVLFYHGGSATYNGAGVDDSDKLIMLDYQSTANAGKNDIDFSSATAPVIRNIETIDMTTAGGDHTLYNLSMQNVYEMTAVNTAHTLTINGDAGDIVNLINSGDFAWSSPELSGGYYNYTVTGDFDGNEDTTETVTLKISSGVTVNDTLLFNTAGVNNGYTGTDTLTFGSADSTVDFSNLGTATISNMETLDVTSGTHTLSNLTPTSVYNMTDELHTLSITGDADDAVTLTNSTGSSWSTPTLSNDSSHYTYTATGDFDNNTATPDETVTLKVDRAIFDDTLTYAAGKSNDGGLGNDTLTFGTGNPTIDFSSSRVKITNMETLDLTTGTHTLNNLTAQNVLDMTASNPTHVVTIKGDSADHVNLTDVLSSSADGSWNATTSAYNDGTHYYTEYSGYGSDGTSVTIRIEDEIAKQLTTKS